MVLVVLMVALAAALTAVCCFGDDSRGVDNGTGDGGGVGDGDSG